MLGVMATCIDCEQEMTTASGCTIGTLTLEGRTFQRAPVAKKRGISASGRCGDCGAAPGHHHHLGCDVADCPACGWQLLSCECGFDELAFNLADSDEEYPFLVAV